MYGWVINRRCVNVAAFGVFQAVRVCHKKREDAFSCSYSTIAIFIREEHSRSVTLTRLDVSGSRDGFFNSTFSERQ